MNFNKKVYLVLATATFSIGAFAANNFQKEIDAADSLYQNGECEKAIQSYSAIEATNLSNENKDKVVFRTAYCQFTLGNYAESESNFKKYLEKNSKDEEANLKVAQSTLYQNKFSDAEFYAKKINSNDYKADAMIVIARSKMETDQEQEAINTLKPYLNNAEANYWSAMAYMNLDDEKSTIELLKSAISKSSNDSWVKTDSQNWLSKLGDNKRRFHFKTTIGAIHDSNIDQSGSAGTVGSVQNGQTDPGAVKANYSTQNYTKSNGAYAALDFYHDTYSTKKFNLATTLSGSTPFYFGHAAYNQQQVSLDLTGKYTQSSSLNFGTSLKYLDTFYNKKYSQDYVYATPFLSWSFANSYWLKLSIPYTSYLNSKSINIYGLSADLSVDPTTWMSLSLGTSYSKSKGKEAVIVTTGSALALVSGTIFSQYKSYGAYAGATFYPVENFQVGFTGSYYKTDYDLEKIPGTIRHQPRQDKLTSYSIYLGKSFFDNAINANLSYSHSKNKSEGFPGLISNGSVSNNSYTRGYSMFTLSYYY